LRIQDILGRGEKTMMASIFQMMKKKTQKRSAEPKRLSKRRFARKGVTIRQPMSSGPFVRKGSDVLVLKIEPLAQSLSPSAFLGCGNCKPQVRRWFMSGITAGLVSREE